MIIDSHCHLNYEPMSLELNEVLIRATKVGVKYLLTISVNDKTYEKILVIIENHKQVFGTYGIHPHEAKSHHAINSETILNKIKKSKKIIGIGETGLDFFYNHSDKNSQIALFKEHIKASQVSNLPLIIHTRSAETETLEILTSELKNKKFNFVIHCFTGSKTFANELIDLGAYISASGIITFKNSNTLAETFKHLPNDRILIETDSPYLAPMPLRGKSNEPSYITHTLNFLSKLKNIDPSELAHITSSNFFKLFGKLN